MGETKPFVILELDKPRKFRFTLNHLVEFEEITGISMEDALGNISMIRKILWLGLKDEDSDLTENEVGGFVDSMPKFMEIIEHIGPIIGVDSHDGEIKNVPRAAIPSKKRKPPKHGTGTSPSKRPSV